MRAERGDRRDALRGRRRWRRRGGSACEGWRRAEWEAKRRVCDAHPRTPAQVRMRHARTKDEHRCGERRSQHWLAKCVRPSVALFITVTFRGGKPAAAALAGAHVCDVATCEGPTRCRAPQRERDTKHLDSVRPATRVLPLPSMGDALLHIVCAPCRAVPEDRRPPSWVERARSMWR